MARGLGLVLGLALLGCGEAGSTRVLRLLEFRQQDFDSVALNEELAFYFSEDLDRSSVTTDSVRLVDESGREVSGERAVRGNALFFRANLPLAPDLSDGGLRPGQRYRAYLGGFPRVDGLRATSGALLSAGLQLSFATARPGSAPLFLDPFLGPFRLRPRGRPAANAIVIEDGRLVLEYGEALDPSSVPKAVFQLEHVAPGGADPEVILAVPHLIENRRNHSELLLELRAADGFGSDRLPPGTYFLRMPGFELRNLGGRWVELPLPALQLNVPKPPGFEFPFAGESAGTLPSSCSGTAHWRPGEGFRLRFPAAAGNGEDGPVELRAPPQGSDVQATHLLVQGDEGVDLSAHVGPLVLRSQTALEIRGRLARRGAAAHDDPLSRGLRELQRMPRAERTLSAWVSELLDPSAQWKAQPWTVLIAGGDLVVPRGGALEVEGPLVLVAGGKIRVEGVTRSESDLWHSSGFEGNLAAKPGGMRELPLLLDEPALNPLRTRLVVGALITPPQDWMLRSGRWQALLVGRQGSGSAKVLFVQPASGGAARLLSDPNDLAAGPVRAFLQLEMGPGHGEAFVAPRAERLMLELLPARP